MAHPEEASPAAVAAPMEELHTSFDCGSGLHQNEIDCYMR